jgi:cytochrome c oxidase cbb3-type subunit IV
MDFALIHSIWTVMMFILFIGIVVWAWSAKRKKQFDEAARLPLEDDDAVPASPRREKNHV